MTADTTAVQQRNEPASIVLPPTRTSVPAPQTQTPTGLDAFLLVLLFLLTCGVASTPSRTSDLWMHLAAGKLLLSGEYHFGSDPFAYTTSNAYWVNHAWLSDALMYLVHIWPDGPGLVRLKAGLLILIALLLVAAGEVNGRLWVPVVCTAVAVLAISRWFPLQPVVFSCLYFALTFILLERPRWRRAKKAASWTAYWPLLPLFALWVNMDDWFVLGPLTVALYWFGELLDGRRDGKSDGRALGVILLLGVAACVLNPHHIRAFTLPWHLGLSEAGRVLRQDPAFRGQFVSPLEALYYRVDVGLNPAGLAYWVLVALSLLAFVLNYAGWRWRRVLPWTAMLGLSLFSARTIPFFAVAAAPIVAINLQEFASRRTCDAALSKRRRWQHYGRLLTALAGVLLIVAAWPGWLAQPPYERRRWNVDVDASLQRVGEQLADWHRSGALPPDARGFNLSVDAANQLAFLCPDEKAFFDHRLALFSRETATDFLLVRQAIAGSLPLEEAAMATKRGEAGRANWRGVFRKWHINHVVLHDNSLNRSMRLFRSMMANEREFVPLLLDGRTAVFGWIDPEQPQAAATFAPLASNLKRRASQPSAIERAPAQWPGRDPEPREWWNAFVMPAASRAPETDEATFYVNYFDDLKPRYFNEHLKNWTNAQSAQLVAMLNGGDAAGAAALGTGLRASLSGLFLLHPPPAVPDPDWEPTTVQATGLQLMNGYFLRLDDAPAYLPVLAVRAARRAIHANPDEPYAYLALGEAYMRLLGATRERWATAGQRMPYLQRIRQLQAITAFSNALILNPDLAQAHLHLADLYRDLRYVDLVLHHRRQYVQLTRAAGPPPGPTTKQFSDRIAMMEEEVEQLDTAVKELLDIYEVNSENLKVGQRAQMAHARGLGAKALEILLASDITAFQKEGLELELTLLLSTGRIREFRAWFAPEHEEELGGYAYQWFHIYLAGASGDYEEADRRFAALEPPEVFRGKVAESIAQAILDGRAHQQGPGFVFITRRSLSEMLGRLDRWTLQQYHRADLTVVRGLLALEQGNTERATSLFRQAIAVADAATPGGKAEFNGRALAEASLEMLTEN